MAQLLSILMVFNMLGAITIVPAFYCVLRPKNTASLLTPEEHAAHATERTRNE
jgi:hypothetical protein